MIYDNLKTYYASVEMPGGWYFDHVETLKTIDLYYNSQFKTGAYDSRGFRKFFYNRVKPACDIASKFCDLDTKDITLYPEHGDDELRVWMMQKDLKIWLKKNDFGVLLNDIVQDYPKYGHVFIKRQKDGKWGKTHIQNLRYDPASDSLDTDEFFYELHRMTKRDIGAMTSWDQTKVEELFERQGEVATYDIYECYDYNSGIGKPWKFSIKAGLFTRKQSDGTLLRGTEAMLNSENEDYLPEIVLYEGQVDAPPFRELRWESVPGRRLGLGFVEYLFDNQIAENEAENLERKGLYYTALHLFQTKDPTVGSNVLTDAENGDILKTISEVLPVQTEERNLAAFNATRGRWADNTVQKTFTTEISRGENLPSRTPLGVANLQASMVASYFDLKRENLGLFLKKLFLEEIIPSFKDKSKEEHILTFMGSDSEIDKLDGAIGESLLQEKAWEYAEKTGFFPSSEEMESERQRIKGELRKRKNRHLKIPAREYENVVYFLDVNITGEQRDVGVQNQTLQTLLQIVGTNPAVLANRATRAILFKIAENGGVSPVDLNLIGEQIDQNPQEVMAMAQGGSVAGSAGAQSGRMESQRTI